MHLKYCNGNLKCCRVQLPVDLNARVLSSKHVLSCCTIILKGKQILITALKHGSSYAEWPNMHHSLAKKRLDVSWKCDDKHKWDYMHFLDYAAYSLANWSAWTLSTNISSDQKRIHNAIPTKVKNMVGFGTYVQCK